MSDETTELQSLSKLKIAGRLRYWRGTIEIPETELHAICDEIQAEHDHALAATLGSGMLTAEQVREAIEKRFDFDVWVPTERWQAIADELNAELGSGTCEWLLEHSGTLYDKWRCSKCGYLHVESRTDGGATDLDPNYCPNCGKKVEL